MFDTVFCYFKVGLVTIEATHSISLGTSASEDNLLSVFIIKK